MTKVNIYLNFNGNCEEAFLFYKSVLGNDFSYVGRFKDMPANQEQTIDPEFGEKIMHIALPISQETMLMGSDVGGEWAPNFKQGNNFTISVTVDSQAEADRVFAGLSAGGMVTMPMNKTFWGDYFGMFTDKFGINWMISFPTQQQG